LPGLDTDDAVGIGLGDGSTDCRRCWDHTFITELFIYLCQDRNEIKIWCNGITKYTRGV
ncbi:35076_t:CDS:2, partial [Racocetra persica]